MTATDRQIETCDLFRELGSPVAVAKKLGISEMGVIKNLCYGAINGQDICLSPDRSSQVAPPGWSAHAKSIMHRNGEVVIQWDKIRPDEQAIEQMWKHLENRTPVLPQEIQGPEDFDHDLCVEWLLMDHHLGLYSWASETGADYNIEIAQDLMIRAAQKIFQGPGNVQQAVIVLGGDNLHADNRSAMTEKSKHHLDVDSRYAKSVDAIYAGMAAAIDLALAKAIEVRVVVLSGNHDYHTAINLSRILKAHYRANTRVSIDTSPAKHRFFRFGSTYFMYTHGDTGNNNRLSSFMLNDIRKRGLQGVDRMYVRQGHLHKRGRNTPPGLTEEDGVVVELFPTLAAPDSYAHEQAYQSTRATVANIWHKRWGQRSRMELGVQELMGVE